LNIADWKRIANRHLNIEIGVAIADGQKTTLVERKGK
jgi:hypothetical protein